MRTRRTPYVPPQPFPFRESPEGSRGYRDTWGGHEMTEDLAREQSALAMSMYRAAMVGVSERVAVAA